MIGHYKKHNGFALLYAIVMISVISAIAFGLATISYKQKILSSIAVDSQTAFYAADAGMECALYNRTAINNGNAALPCHEIDPTNFGQVLTLTKVAGAVPPLWRYSGTRKETCFSIEMGPVMGGVRPSFIAKGYNTCTPVPNRYVERVLRAFF